MNIFKNVSRLFSKKMSKKISYPSAERNKAPILEVLRKYIDQSQTGKLLEVASGTGQHSAYFASYFTNLTFQPSEYDSTLFESIQAYADDLPSKNMKSPIKVDVTTDVSKWKLPLNEWNYIININMIHISPFTTAVGLFKNGAQLLKRGGYIFTYGPYANNGVLEPESNVNFDRGLRSQNPLWGVRDIQELKKVAAEYGIELVDIHDLPSNNKCLVWRKN